MIRKIILALCISLSAIAEINALEITRYVSATGTGDGMTEQTPTSDLYAMLKLGDKVDWVNLKVSPGFYTFNIKDVGEVISFRNILLDGTWQKGDSNDKVRINFGGIKFVNSRIKKVSFSGGVGISNGVLDRCDADGSMTMDLNEGDGLFESCLAKTFVITNYAHRANSSARVLRCQSDDGGGYGLIGENIGRLVAVGCDFSNKTAGGANINGCRNAIFERCTFSFNKGDGALRLIEFDNSGTANFSKCEFLFNEVTYNHQFNIQVHSNATFTDCLFVGNTEKDYDRKGVVHLARADFRFTNCTFIDNAGAIELENFYPSEYQIQNCAFWNNGKTNVYAPGGVDVPLRCCAMDYGTGIPELDAEKGILHLTEQNKGFWFTGTEIEIEPTSVLINMGLPRPLYDTDIYYHPRNVFDATDIGCVEFISMPGMWQPDSLSLSTEWGVYNLAKANVNDKTFYCLFPEYNTSFEVPQYSANLLYLDKMPMKPKVHADGELIERHLHDSEGYTVDVTYFHPQICTWVMAAIERYATEKQRPTVKIESKNIKFVKPTQASKLATAKKSNTTAAKKKPVTRKR